MCKNIFCEKCQRQIVNESVDTKYCVGPIGSKSKSNYGWFNYICSKCLSENENSKCGDA